MPSPGERRSSCPKMIDLTSISRARIWMTTRRPAARPSNPFAGIPAGALLRWSIGSRTRRPGWVIKSTSGSSAPAGHRFPREVIAVAARWYPRFYGLSYRDVEELLAERGVEVDHLTIYAGCRPSPRNSSTRPSGAALPRRAIAEAILAAKHAKVRVQNILEDDYPCQDPPLPTHGRPAARTRATGLSTPRPCAPTSTSTPT
jgi:hypothetical protein